MLKRILVGLVVLIVAGATAFFVIAPGHVERGLNPLTMPEGGWPVSPEAAALHERLQAQGVPVLETLPDELGPQLISRYLAWKRGGVL